MLKRFFVGAVLFASIVGAGAARASIYDTGLGANGSVDPHWAVAQVAGDLFTNLSKLQPFHAFVATDPYGSTSPGNAFPFNYWSPPLSGSQWIVPTKGGPAVTLDPRVDGYYLYTQKFSVTAGQNLSGQFLADNDVTSITLFDLKTFQLTTIYSGPGEGGFTTPTSFFSGALTGDNYLLSFVVDNFKQNGGNPSGLDVEVAAVPEASTWAMMILGFLGLGFLGYRKKSSLRLA